MNAIDVALAGAAGLLVALAATHGRVGALHALVAVLALAPLVRLAQVSALAATGLAALLAASAALAAGRRSARRRAGRRAKRAWGAVGGALLGVAFVVSVATAYPAARSAFDPDVVVYPAPRLDRATGGRLAEAWTTGVGRDIVFAPLLAAAGDAPSPIARALHAAWVGDTPWRPEGGDRSSSTDAR
ncbi:MAG: hypothetical protein RI554_04855 [Trueperaceae bacterium]|nr:hypothetical protein [Trueperaceae bacterium]